MDTMSTGMEYRRLGTDGPRGRANGHRYDPLCHRQRHHAARHGPGLPHRRDDHWQGAQEWVSRPLLFGHQGEQRLLTGGHSGGHGEQPARFQSNQPPYTMFNRGIEAEDIPFCGREGIGILVHSPLAKGLLTGKYTPDHTFADDDERSRFQGETFARYLDVAGRLEQVARARGLTLIQLAIAWILRLPAITCVLVGAKSPAQVKDHLRVIGVTLGDDELARIEKILHDLPAR